ncbi:hypothetical protein J2785_007227 [Burkholderia ambifaria]|nr:hypothetical protein [Burkholderia ambifaria]
MTSLDCLVPEILFGSTGLVGIITPIGMAFVFLERTQSITDLERSLLAKKVATNIFFTLLVIACIELPRNLDGSIAHRRRVSGGRGWLAYVDRS